LELFLQQFPQFLGPCLEYRVVFMSFPSLLWLLHEKILALHKKSQLGILHRFWLLVMIVQLLLRQMMVLWHIATCTRPMGVVLLVVVLL
jgi:hypothetical protein